MTQKIVISGGGPYGFKIRGGADINQGIFVSSVSAFSKAELEKVLQRGQKLEHQNVLIYLHTNITISSTIEIPKLKLEQVTSHSQFVSTFWIVCWKVVWTRFKQFFTMIPFRTHVEIPVSQRSPVSLQSRYTWGWFISLHCSPDTVVAVKTTIVNEIFSRSLARNTSVCMILNCNTVWPSIIR